MSTKNSEIYQWGIGPSKQDWHNKRCKRPHLYYIRKKKKKLTESSSAGSEFTLIDGGKHFGKTISQLHLDKKLFN